jgi:tetratricopeptide (TPR) repeat protein
MCRNRRKKAVNLWKHTRRRLRLAGYGRPSLQAESEWAQRGDAVVAGTYAMYLGAAAARFAPEYHHEDFIALQNAYRVFSESYRKSVSRWRRLLAWVLPINARLTVLLLLIILAGSGRAQDDDHDALLDANNLFRSAIEAEYSEYWERAIELYKEGSGKYPYDIRFPRALGELYYSRSLYSLAWDEYRKAELINPLDISILFSLANTAGHLNHNRTSVSYLEKLLVINPNSMEAINNLGWMYYKVHRLADGERLLSQAIERFGESADFSMTLATVYSDMYRYDEGKHWYQKAIAQAEPMRSFTAVAHYNLSILESRFYHYDLAMEEANASIYAQNRASGLLARGELNMRRLELEKAQADFNDAREVDPSPLAKVNLAQTYQISGRLEESRLYALDCLKASDNSWMINYGIDPIRYKRDIHDILYKTYSGLSRAERFVPCGTLGEKIRSTFRSLSFRFYAAVHRKLYQKHSLAAGDAYSAKFVNTAGRRGESGDAPPLDQFIQYFNAFEPYPRRALFYLHKARDFEVALIPASEGSYNLEEGILLKNKNLITRALGELDPLWESDLISQCYREYAVRDFAAAEELFALNRGALLQAGIALPIEINLQGEELGRREKVIYRALAKAGFNNVGKAHAATAKARFRLDITVQDGAASCELTDTEGGSRPLRRVIPLRSLSKADIYGFAGMLSNSVFRVE